MIKPFDKNVKQSSKWLPHQQLPDALDLTIAEMDLGLFQPFQRSLKHFLKSINISDPENKQIMASRAKNAIKYWYKELYKIEDIKNSQIMFCSSIATLYSAVVEAITDPHDQILVLTPIYSYYMTAGKILNRNVIGSELKFIQQSDSSDFFIDFQDFGSKLQQSKLLVISHPHNPSGRIWNRQQLTRIVQLCQQNNVYLFSDQILGDMALGQDKDKNIQFQTILSLKYEKIILGNSLSKSFNSSSLQSGYAIIRDQSIRNRIGEALRNYNGNVESTNLITSHYYSVCLSQQGKIWLQKINNIFNNNYNSLRKLQKQILPKLILAKFHGGYLTWIDFQFYVTDMNHLKEILENKRIYVLYASNYFIPPRETTQVRICLSVEESVFKQFICRLQEAFGIRPTL